MIPRNFKPSRMRLALCLLHKHFNTRDRLHSVDLNATHVRSHVMDAAEGSNENIKPSVQSGEMGLGIGYGCAQREKLSSTVSAPRHP